jgi:hypothetical protein
MTRRSRILLGMALAVVTLGIGGFLAKAQITAIMTKSPMRDRPMYRAQQEVIAAFGRVEKAIQSGDGALFLALMSRKVVAAQTDAIKVTYLAGLPPRPDARLEPIAVCVRGENAFVIGTFEERASERAKTYLVRYVREDQAWKIASLRTTDATPYRPAIYAYLPPQGGAFTLAGLPWRSIGYAGSTSVGSWKVQATRDENFLYVRFETNVGLPAHGAEVPAEQAKLMKSSVPDGPPLMTIAVSGPDDKQTLVRSTFEFHVGHVTLATARPGADTVSSTVEYLLTVRGDRGETLFEGAPGAFSRLIEVHDRFIDVRLPLRSLGVRAHGTPDIAIGELDARAQMQSYKVARFSP